MGWTAGCGGCGGGGGGWGCCGCDAWDAYTDVVAEEEVTAGWEGG